MKLVEFFFRKNCLKGWIWVIFKYNLNIPKKIERFFFEQKFFRFSPTADLFRANSILIFFFLFRKFFERKVAKYRLVSYFFISSIYSSIISSFSSEYTGTGTELIYGRWSRNFWISCLTETRIFVESKFNA